MFKKIFLRGFTGFAFGVMIGQLVSIIISLFLGNGNFILLYPDFRELFNYEIVAVIVQTVLTGVIGIVFALASLVFEIEKWNPLKQYVVHFLITSIVWLPIVDLIWIPKGSKASVYIINLLITYTITWFIQYQSTKNDIRKINERINSEYTKKE